MVRDDHCQFLSVRQTAHRLGVAEITVRRWIRRGCLPAIQPYGPGGHIGVPRATIDALARSDGAPPEAEPSPHRATPAAHEQPTTANPTHKASVPGPPPRWMRR